MPFQQRDTAGHERERTDASDDPNERFHAGNGTPVAFVSVTPPRSPAVGTECPDQEFAEPVAVSSTSEQCIRLPPSSSPGGFGLVPPRARRDAHAAPSGDN